MLKGQVVPAPASQQLLDAKAFRPGVDDHLAAYDHTAIAHSNRTALNAVSGVNTGDQDLTGLVHTNRTALDAVSGVNTGDQDLSGYQATLVSGTNIKTVNGTTLLGSGDITVSGSTTVTQVEVDFGATPMTDKEFTITDAAVTAASKILVSPAYEDTTDKTADEIAASNIIVAAGKAAAGSFVLMVASATETLMGKYKFNYVTG